MRRREIKNKVIASVLAFLMLFGMILSVPGLEVAASTNPTLDFTVSKTVVKPNDEVEITVSLKDYNASVGEISGLQVNIPIDTSVLEYVENSVQTIAQGVGSDMSEAVYNAPAQEIRYMYLSMNVANSFPRSNTEVLSFKLKVKEGATNDAILQLANAQLLIAYESGTNVTIPVSNTPSFNVLVAKPVITLNGMTPAAAPYTGAVTVAFDKGTATISKDGGVAEAITSGSIVSARGNYTVVVTDAVGNTQSTAFVVVWQPQSIAMKTLPTNRNVSMDSNFNPMGGVVEITYSNGEKENVPLTAAMCDVTNVGSTLGAKAVTVTHLGFTTTFDIEVVDKQVESISLKSAPTKTQYVVETDIVVTGGQITVKYDNGSSEDINITAAMLSGYNKNQLGTQSIRVTYEGKTTNFTVQVVDKSVTSIAVTVPPTKTHYIEGTAFDETGMVVTAYYDNGTSSVVTDYVVANPTVSLGETKVGISYQGQSTSTPITVQAKSAIGIALDVTNARPAFFEDDAYQVAGLAVVVKYDNDTTEAIPATAAMVSGFDSSEIGEQTLTVTYNTFTATYKVQIISRQAVNDVIASIDEIEVDKLTLDDMDKVYDSWYAYTALSEMEREEIKNIEELVEAMDRIYELAFPEYSKYFLGEKVLIQAKVGVIPYYADVKVTEVAAPAEVIEQIRKDYGAASKVALFFSAVLEDEDGNVIMPAGEIKVSLKLDETYGDVKDLLLVGVAEDGTITVIKAEVVDGYLTFMTDNFESYGIMQKITEVTTPEADKEAEEGKETESDKNAKPDEKAEADKKAEAGKAVKTGDSATILLWVGLILISTGAITVIVIRKKRVVKKFK